MLSRCCMGVGIRGGMEQVCFHVLNLKANYSYAHLKRVIQLVTLVAISKKNRLLNILTS